MFDQIGDGFDRESGIFTAKHAGVYIFTVSAAAHFNEWTYLPLLVNDKTMCTALAGDVGSYHHIGCSITVKLNPNDRVYVKLAQGRIRTDTYSVFTGVLVQTLN